MTVIAAVLHPDGLVVIGDRAAVDQTSEVAPGLPAVLPDITKVLRLPGDLVVAAAGELVSADGSANVLAELGRLGGHRDAAHLARVVAKLLERLAPELRAQAGPLDTSGLPLIQEAVTLVLVAGVTFADPQVWAVTLTRSSIVVTLVEGAGKVIGPASCMPDLELSLLSAASATTLEKVSADLEGAIAAACRRELALVSSNLDAVLLHADGRVESRKHRQPAKPVIGRH